METGYKGTNRMITGIVLGVLTFWLFAQSLLNIGPAVQSDLGISLGTLNVAISLTALLSGLFVVVFGGLSDRFGRKKVTYIGLILSIIGSLCLIFAQGSFLLIIGRAIQGFSAACIMPATIALVKAYYEGADRQRAMSYWSIGSWGGSGLCSLVGGAIATYMGWKWIFIFSILVALLSMFLIKDTPESKAEQTNRSTFDYSGLVVFIITMLSLNLLITRGREFGWTSPLTLSFIAVTIIGSVIFFKIENNKINSFIDFSLFKNKAYTGSVLSNFLVNSIAGTLFVANTYVQVGRGLTAFQSGLLSLGYVVAVLSMIRVGEKLLQRHGAKKPMILGITSTGIGVGLMAFTLLPGTVYIAVVFVGFILFGIGLGMFATPSLDTAVTNAPEEKVGEASGLFKMASSLGASFGIAISATVYGALSATTIERAASAGFITNVLFAIISLLAVLLVIPKYAGDLSRKNEEKEKVYDRKPVTE